MATLHSYVDKDGYYVRHSFATGGKLFHVIYQTTDVAIRRLTAHGIRNGNLVPSGLLHELINSGELFTGKTGASAITIDSEESKDTGDTEINLSSLSAEARKWFSLMILSHPFASADMQTLSGNDDGMRMEIKGVPKNYIEQLLVVASRFDGTSFFENLRLSCKHLPPEANFRLPDTPTRTNLY